MSPLSVAQYLPATGRRFDLVVFDEASQICTHDAIGAIGRGDQLVVVGDSKQLPPTAFFARAATEEAAVDDNDFTELESILDEVSASGMPEQMLGWHYRSRHQSLIEFSNQHYYENRLNIFPAARADVADLGVKFHLVENGVYEMGKSRTNPREGQALVDHLFTQLRQTSPSKRTFGVVTFSSTQQELIEDLIEEARRRYPEAEPHFADDHPTFEKVFVKNLENVQGDERDEIFFSIAYAPDEQGRMLMNFGPLNRTGGERRLNVAVTRARKQLRVFSSIRADQIDTHRTNATGVRHLKSFLRFAAERHAPSTNRSGELSGDFDSDFERDVYDFLRTNGYRVDTQVGAGGYRIDMAVAHPEAEGVYALGIECDGAAYHSGATARDRDRLRQQVLEGLGWHLHRIWSTDWSFQRAAEGDRLIQAVEQACRKAITGSDAPVRASDPPSAPPVIATTTTASTKPKIPVVSYRRAELKQVTHDSDVMYEPAQLRTLQRLVVEVLRVEAPVHLDEITRRVGEAFGLQRIGARSRRRVQEVVNTCADYAWHDEFVWPTNMPPTTDVPIREGKDRDLETLPPEEVAAAARWVLVQALSIPMSDLLRETARVFGIQRRGAKVDERMRLGVDVLMKAKLCSLEAERVVWRS
jgi:very-short-patch-repair endonuclease